MPEIINDQLRASFELAIELGLAAATCTIEETDQVCHTHQVALIEERARTIHGWKQAISCPASDGTCAFDRTDDVSDCDGPKLYEDVIEQIDIVLPQ